MCDDQSATIKFLGRAESYALMGTVEMIETHISCVFLVVERAFKLKRAVKLPYVDFSSSAMRLSLCLKEVMLNSRTAPELYLGVRRITRDSKGNLGFDGPGETVDAVVEMRRFPQEHLFDRMARANQLTIELMEAVAQAVAAFHIGLPARHICSGSVNIEAVLDVNRRGFATSNVFSEDEIHVLDEGFRTALEAHRARLDHREAGGMIRHCHGDLHLRNICLTDNGPRLFDCIEFNDQLATVDVLYDLAFLLMDLWQHGLRNLANLVMNRYLDMTSDNDGISLLSFFMALRAAVRAHVVAHQSRLAPDKTSALAIEAQSYFKMAIDLLEPPSPILIAIGGLSGSGKSTVAEALAAHIGVAPGVRIFESDRLRKAMFSVTPVTRLQEEAYRPHVSESVYKGLCNRAGAALASQCPVIVDAVFDKAENRISLEQVGTSMGVPFVGIWLKADHSLLKSRILGRKTGASDATLDVLEAQEAKDIGAINWRVVDAKLPIDAIVEILLQEIDIACQHLSLPTPICIEC